MDAGNSAFAELRNVIGKVNLLSSFQMSEEVLASSRRKNLEAQSALHSTNQRIHLYWEYDAFRVPPRG